MVRTLTEKLWKKQQVAELINDRYPYQESIWQSNGWLAEKPSNFTDINNDQIK